VNQHIEKLGRTPQLVRIIRGRHWEAFPAAARDVLTGTGVTLPDTYLRVSDANKEGEERPLHDEPFFREAASLAPVVATEIGFDAFTAVATQSSELQAVNSALNAGAQIENLVGAPPIIMCESSAPSRGEQPQLRPWWKFWG